MPIPRLAPLVLAATLVAASGAAGQAAPGAPAAPLPAITLPPALDRVLRDYERAWRARDASGLAALFTDDGFVLSGGHPPVRGRGAIRERYTGQGGPLYLRALAYAADDTVGYIIGLYGDSPADPAAGKYVLLLRRQPGGPWRIAADMDNPNRPPRPGPRPAPAPGSPPGSPR